MREERFGGAGHLNIWVVWHSFLHTKSRKEEIDEYGIIMDQGVCA